MKKLLYVLIVPVMLICNAYGAVGFGFYNGYYYQDTKYIGREHYYNKREEFFHGISCGFAFSMKLQKFLHCGLYINLCTFSVSGDYHDAIYRWNHGFYDRKTDTYYDGEYVLNSETHDKPFLLQNLLDLTQTFSFNIINTKHFSLYLGPEVCIGGLLMIPNFFATIKFGGALTIGIPINKKIDLLLKSGSNMIIRRGFWDYAKTEGYNFYSNFCLIRLLV
ncbi:MAG: hypothetical protein A2096_10165 [Spirochaetes bacterium GWF1_41_5]|nr:MAG: hypothetical protein A2096_10165 [Spirochaetes bacterium GWF1_41_5]